MLFGGCTKREATSPPTSVDAATKAEAEKLLDSLIPFAKEMLQKHHAFLPFGGHIASDGTIGHEGAYNGQEQPPSQELLKILKQAHQRDARDKKIRACATIYDIRTIPPGRTQKQDAIAAAVDHVSGYSVVVVFPYTLDAEKKLIIEPPFVMDGGHDIFLRPDAAK
jgi:hypothetical protein